jgi:hypothetical protein
METGQYPMWSEKNELKPFDGWYIMEKEVIQGIPKTIYGLWLEEQLNIKRIRDEYHEDTGCYPTYFSNRNAPEKFSSNYTSWLEEKMLAIKN